MSLAHVGVRMVPTFVLAYVVPKSNPKSVLHSGLFSWFAILIEDGEFPGGHVEQGERPEQAFASRIDGRSRRYWHSHRLEQDVLSEGLGRIDSSQ